MQVLAGQGETQCSVLRGFEAIRGCLPEKCHDLHCFTAYSVFSLGARTGTGHLFEGIGEVQKKSD